MCGKRRHPAPRRSGEISTSGTTESVQHIAQAFSGRTIFWETKKLHWAGLVHVEDPASTEDPSRDLTG